MPRPLSIAYIGDFDQSWYTESHVAATLESMGHVVDRIDERLLFGPKQLIERCIGSDLTLYTRHHGLPSWATDAWYALTSDGVPTVSFHLDLYWGLKREKLIHDHDPMFTTEWVCTPDGDLSSPWDDAGIQHLWVPPACFGPEVGRAMPMPEYECDVMFVGSDGDAYHREWPHRAELLKWLRSHYGARFLRLGPPGMVRGEQLSRAYASAKVVVGDSCLLRKRYWSDRVPDTLGRGGVLVMPRHLNKYADPTMTEWHPQVATWPLFNWDALRALIEERIAWSEHKRSSMRDDGVSDVAARHTYTNRMQYIFDQVFVPV